MRRLRGSGERKNLMAAVLAAVCLAVVGVASAGVFGHAFVPNTTGGVQISCANPHSILGAVRTDEATTVFQARPDGVHWQVVLPPMVNDFDHVRQQIRRVALLQRQVHLAPNGEPAIDAVGCGRDDPAAREG